MNRTAAQHRRTSRGTRASANEPAPQVEKATAREDTRELGPLTGQPDRKVHSIGPFRTSRPLMQKWLWRWLFDTTSILTKV